MVSVDMVYITALTYTVMYLNHNAPFSNRNRVVYMLCPCQTSQNTYCSYTGSMIQFKKDTHIFSSSNLNYVNFSKATVTVYLLTYGFLCEIKDYFLKPHLEQSPQMFFYRNAVDWVPTQRFNNSSCAWR